MYSFSSLSHMLTIVFSSITPYITSYARDNIINCIHHLPINLVPIFITHGYPLFLNFRAMPCEDPFNQKDFEYSLPVIEVFFFEFPSNTL